MKRLLTRDELWSLRQEIPIGSLYLADYENSFGIDKHEVSAFFDGYIDFLDELMQEDGVGDKDYWNSLTNYDNAENLDRWYGCFDSEYVMKFEPEPDEEEQSDDMDYYIRWFRNNILGGVVA